MLKLSIFFFIFRFILWLINFNVFIGLFFLKDFFWKFIIENEFNGYLIEEFVYKICLKNEIGFNNFY